MKYLIVLPLALLCLSFTALAQKQKTRTFVISYGHGKGKIAPALAVTKASGANSSGPLKLIELNFYQSIGRHSYIETGISFLDHQYTFTKFDYTPQPAIKQFYRAIYIPLKIRFDVAKYFFISGGLSTEFKTSKGSKDGNALGAGIGAGLQYYHQNKYGIFIYPQINVHSLDIGLIERHISFGLAYRIPRP